MWPLLALLTLVPHGATAHEFWLAPSRYEAVKGATVELSAVAGTGFRGEKKPWSPDHAVRYVLRGAKAIDLTRAASPGELVWTRFVPADDGGALVAFESDYLPIELPAALFDHYLKAEGLDGPLSARKGVATPGRERYRRCAKTWLAGSDGSRATITVGMPLELVPDAVPGAAGALGVRLLRDGRPLAGTLVKAWQTPLDASGTPRAVFERDSVAVAWQGRSDAAGHVRIPVHQAGEWLVSAVDMEPCPDRQQADWESTWASLSFATRPASSSPAARGTSARP